MCVVRASGLVGIGVAGEAGLFDRSSAPQAGREPHPPERVAVIVGAAPAADDRSRDRRDARDAALDRLGRAEAQRDRQARPDRARAAGPLRALDGRASSSTSTSRSSAGSRAAPASASAAAHPATAGRDARRHRQPRGTAAGSTSTSPSTTTAGSPTPKSSPTKARPPRSASSARRSPSTAATASPSSGPDRQRLRLPPTLHALACRAARHPAPPHPAPPATDQRQSRTLHPHPAQRLGLRRDLPLKQRTHPRP